MTYDLTTRYQAILKMIENAAIRYLRSPKDIRLLAVSKGQDIDAISQLYSLGQRHFGENYWQEARGKIEALQCEDIKWHYLGKLQSNKIKMIAKHFSWVHSVTKLSELEAFAKYRCKDLSSLNICLEVYVPGALNTEALSLDMVKSIVQLSQQWPQLRIRGLMVMAEPNLSTSQTTAVFSRVLEHYLYIKNNFNSGFDTLSMGMSGDFELAIGSGSTMVRIGQLLFGTRSKSL